MYNIRPPVQAMIWDLISPSPLQRMNVVVSARVDPGFFASLEACGKSAFPAFLAAADDATAEQLRGFVVKRRTAIDTVHVLRGAVRHHLRRGLGHHCHHEQWWFALLSDGGERRLCPLWRTSDGPAPPFSAEASLRRGQSLERLPGAARLHAPFF